MGNHREQWVYDDMNDEIIRDSFIGVFFILSGISLVVAIDEQGAYVFTLCGMVFLLKSTIHYLKAVGKME